MEVFAKRKDCYFDHNLSWLFAAQSQKQAESELDDECNVFFLGNVMVYM